MTRDKAMSYAREKFPELEFGTQIKIATAYLDGAIDTTIQLRKEQEWLPRNAQNVKK